MNLSSVEVDSSALLANVNALRSLAHPSAKVAAVIKGNAYGHGLELIAKILEGAVDYFQVDDFEELKRLRTVSNVSALILGYVAPWELSDALDLGCEFGVFDLEYASELISVCRKKKTIAKVHLKIDALLGRLGVLPDQLESLLDEVSRYSELEIVGIYAHFANIEDTTDLTHAQAQREILEECGAVLKGRGLSATPHISATSGLIAMESEVPHLLVRLGIGVYGMYPSLPLSRSHRSLGLAPALTWKTHLAQVKVLPPKHPIGYGLTFVTSSTTRIGIVPLGYSDGFDRGLSNSGEVLVAGRRCAVLGRIAMNMFAIDLNDVETAKAGDEVVLIGAQEGDRIYAEEMAARIGTINYEITSRIAAQLPRVRV